jgi:hypothetical protein
MKKLLLIAVFLLLAPAGVARKAPPNKIPIMVFEARCIHKFAAKKDTRIEIPMDGDLLKYDKARLFNMDIAIDTTCGIIKMQKRSEWE